MAGIMDAIMVVESEVPVVTPEDIEEAYASIVYAVESIDAMVTANEALDRARRTGNKLEIHHAEKLHRILRFTMQKDFADTTETRLVAEEDDSDPASTESKEGKGFIMRMIDAIANAMKWLWDKITGVFTKKPEETTKEAAKDASDTVEKAKKKASEGKQIAPDSVIPNTKRIGGQLSMIGVTPTFATLLEIVEKSAEKVNMIVPMFTDVANTLPATQKMVDAVKADADVEALKTLAETELTAIQTVLGNHFKDPYDPKRHDFLRPGKTGKMWICDNILGNDSLCVMGAWVNEKDGRIRAKFSKYPTSEKEVTIAAPNSFQDVTKLAEAVVAFSGAISKSEASYQQLSSKVKTDLDAMDRALKSAKSIAGKEDTLKVAVEAIQRVSFSMGGISTCLVFASSSLVGGCAWIGKTAVSMTDLDKAKKSDSDKKDEGEEGKPETK